MSDMNYAVINDGNLLIIVLVIASQISSGFSSVNIDEIIKYKQLSYANLPASAARDANIYNSVPTGLARHGERLYIGVARRRLGIPSTLNYIDLKTVNKTNQSPNLVPYPDLETNELHPERRQDENRIISVYRPRVDECERLWFVDTGMIETQNNFVIIQRPSIWVIDLKTDLIINRFEIPRSLIDLGHGLASITIDVDPNSCDDAFAYIPDLQTYRLIVYDYRNNRAWRFITNYFYLNPLEGDYLIKGIKFQWDDGIFSVALGKRNKTTGYRPAYFHAASSYSEFRVSTEVLRNETYVRQPYHGNHFKLLGRRPVASNVGMHAYHIKTGVMFNAELQNYRITCINLEERFRANNIGVVYKNEEKLIYPADLSIDADNNLWFISNALPLHIYTMLNVSCYNFFIWRVSVDTAIKKTICNNRSQQLIFS